MPGNKAECVRHQRPQRPVAGDDSGQAVRRFGEDVDVLLGREPARVQHRGRVVFDADLGGKLDAVRDLVDILEPTAAHRDRELLRAADHGPGPAQQQPEQTRCALCESEVGEAARRSGAVQRDDERPAAEECDRRTGEPVRVYEIGALRGAAESAHRREHEGKREPGTALEAGDEASAVAPGQPVVAVGAGADDLDFDPSSPQVLHGVEDEATGEVVGAPRIRGREDRDLERAQFRSGGVQRRIAFHLRFVGNREGWL